MSTKTPDEIVEEIEAAEEAGDIDKVLEYLDLSSSKGCECKSKSDDEDTREEWAESAEASLDAFYRLIKARDATAVAVAPSSCHSYVHAIFQSLMVWKEEEAIVEVALGCIVAIASKAIAQEEIKSEDCTSDSSEPTTGIEVTLIIDLMKKFPDESTIQEQACLAVEGLALWKGEWKHDLKGVDGIREELIAAREERIANERNKAYPLRAAKALEIDLI